MHCIGNEKQKAMSQEKSIMVMFAGKVINGLYSIETKMHIESYLLRLFHILIFKRYLKYILEPNAIKHKINNSRRQLHKNMYVSI